MSYSAFDLQPTLIGSTITLRPLREADFDALHAAASDPLIWEQHPDPLGRHDMASHWKEQLALSQGSGKNWRTALS